MLNFSEKVHRYFKTILHLCPKHMRRHYALKISPDFDFKEMQSFWFQKICIFWSFFDIFKFNSQLEILLLTKCWLKYYRSIRNLLLMFFIFWINTVSPKLKKIYLMTQTPPKKWSFFGGVCTIRYFFNFGDTVLIQNIKNIKRKFLIDL